MRVASRFPAGPAVEWWQGSKVKGTRKKKRPSTVVVAARAKEKSSD